MSFTSKKLHSQKSGMGYIKGATLFFLGMSCVLFMARAFDISPTATNAVQYIQRIFLTQSGDSNSLTGITLDGTNGNGTFAGSLGADTVNATTVSGTTVTAKTVTAQITVNGTTLSGTNIKGTTITGSTICLANDTSSNRCITSWPTGGTASAVTTAAGLASNIQFNGGNDAFSGTNNLVWKIVSGTGRLGIGIPNPLYELHVIGTGMINGNLLFERNVDRIIKIRPNNGCIPGSSLSLEASSASDSHCTLPGIPNVGGNIVMNGGSGVNGGAYGNIILADKGGNVGIGTTGPTEQLQIGNYTWLGQNVSATSGAGGTFLRMNGVDPQDYDGTQAPDDAAVSEVVNDVNAFIGDPDYSPNIQLNYKWHNGATNYVENWKLIGGRKNFYLHHGDGTALPNEILAISTIGDMQLTNINGKGNFYFINGILSVGPTTSTKQIKMSVDNTGGKISYGAFNNQIYLKSDGNVGIGTNLASTKLYVQGAVTANAYYYSSDKRLKTDITAISDPLQKILNLNGYTFTWKDSGKKDMGVIAQEVEQIFPEIVNTNTEGYKSVEYGNLVAPLIEAVKILNAKVDAQAKEIETLKAMIK